MEITIYDELKIVYPDVFHIMSEDDMNKLNFFGGKPEFALKDEEDHTVITIGHKRINMLLSVLLSSKDIAKRSEKVISKASKEWDYRLIRFESKILGGRKAEGFFYEYKVDDVYMSAVLYVMKMKKSVYYYNFCGRKELKDINELLLSKVMFK